MNVTLSRHWLLRLQSAVAKVRYSQTLTPTLTFAMIAFGYTGADLRLLVPVIDLIVKCQWQMIHTSQNPNALTCHDRYPALTTGRIG